MSRINDEIPENADESDQESEDDTMGCMHAH
jgi:hypothetical protein